MSESTEQQALFQWAAFTGNPLLSLMFHVPNGGQRNARTAARLKSEGVKAGVPDICLPVARGGYHGLFIELKVGRNGLTDAQKRYGDALNQQGYMCRVAYGWDAARQVIEDYLALDGPDDADDRLEWEYLREIMM